jgi:phage tail tape-measure protein
VGEVGGGGVGVGVGVGVGGEVGGGLGGVVGGEVGELEGDRGVPHAAPAYTNQYRDVCIESNKQNHHNNKKQTRG